MVEIGTEWHHWKQSLGKFINAGEFLGISDKTMNKIAFKVGDFLAGTMEPGNREQRLLKELWDVADEEQQRTLANIIVKLVDRDDHIEH